jgi:hypothetical protein
VLLPNIIFNSAFHYRLTYHHQKLGYCYTYIFQLVRGIRKIESYFRFHSFKAIYKHCLFQSFFMGTFCNISKTLIRQNWLKSHMYNNQKMDQAQKKSLTMPTKSISRLHPRCYHIDGSARSTCERVSCAIAQGVYLATS